MSFETQNEILSRMSELLYFIPQKVMVIFTIKLQKDLDLFVMLSYHMASEDWKYWVKIIREHL